MPRVDGVIDVCCLVPIDTTIVRDGSGCIESTTSDLGFVIVTVTHTRDGGGNLQSVDYSIADA